MVKGQHRNINKEEYTKVLQRLNQIHTDLLNLDVKAQPKIVNTILHDYKLVTGEMTKKNKDDVCKPAMIYMQAHNLHYQIDALKNSIMPLIALRKEQFEHLKIKDADSESETDSNLDEDANSDGSSTESNSSSSHTRNKNSDKTNGPSKQKKSSDSQDKSQPRQKTKQEKKPFSAEYRQREKQLSQFNHLIAQWQIKKTKFHLDHPDHLKKDTNQAYGAVNDLITQLDSYAVAYKNSELSLKDFKRKSTGVIQECRYGVLKNHRGYKEVITNLLFAIGTIGIGYALASTYSGTFTPIKCNTDSANKLQETQISVDAIQRIHSSPAQ